MIVLDTYHLTPLKYRTGERATRLAGRLEEARAGGTLVGTSIVSVEEQMKGWLAAIAKEKQPYRQVGPYRELGGLFEFFRGFVLVPFSETEAGLFAGMGGIRIKATDRKIAAIALAHGALLLTANRRDFEQVPGLRFESWLDG